jgi:hypothetical protein
MDRDIKYSEKDQNLVDIVGKAQVKAFTTPFISLRTQQTQVGGKNLAGCRLEYNQM